MNFYSYFQIVKKATFVSSGSLLDHIYVKQTIDSKLKVLQSNVISVYYSDHEAVEVVIEWDKHVHV